VLGNNTKAASETIGAILMIVVVFILVISISGFILSTTQQSPDNLDAEIRFIENEDSTVNVTWTQKLNSEKLVVTNGTETRNLNSVGESVKLQLGPTQSQINVFSEKNGNRVFISQYKPQSFKTSVFMSSSTCDPVGSCSSTVILNETQIFSDRGVNILTLDEGGSFHSYAWFNTDTNNEYKTPAGSLKSDGTADLGPTRTCSNCAQTRAQNHISSIPDNHYVLIVGDGQPGDIDTELNNLYRTVGGEFSGDNRLESNDSWIIVSKKQDSGQYRVIFEKHAPRGDQSGISKVEGYFIAP